LSEYSSSYDEDNIENCGKPLPRYVELYQGKIPLVIPKSIVCHGLTHTAELADGGAGLICFGNIPISRNNMENYNNAILDPDQPWDAVAAFAPAVKAAKSRGALCMPQLNFPGRQVPDFLNKNPKSSSDVQLEPSLLKTYGKPTPLTKAEIEDLKRRFVWASETLAKAGADGIVVCIHSLAVPFYNTIKWLILFLKLHGSHGYIMNQFLSPKVNKRTDQVSRKPTFQRVSQLNLNSMAEVWRTALALSSKLSMQLKPNCHPTNLSSELSSIAKIVNTLSIHRGLVNSFSNVSTVTKGGSSFAEQCVVIKWLEDAGVDFFDISGGVYTDPAWKGDMPEIAERPVRKERGR
jgi:hypothetical protein